MGESDFKDKINLENIFSNESINIKRSLKTLQSSFWMGFKCL